jgi:hypothetical protein
MAADALGFVHRRKAKEEKRGKCKKGKVLRPACRGDCEKSGLSLAELRSGSRRDRLPTVGTKIVRGLWRITE